MRLTRIAAAALLAVTATAHAGITTLTNQASFLSLTGAATDNLNSLAVLAGSTNASLGVGSLARSAGAIGYTVSTENALWVVPVAGTIAMSVDGVVDSLTLASFSQPVLAVGGNFFATSFATGEVTSGGITLLATDINGLTQSASLPGNSASGFMGFVSDVPLLSLKASLNAAAIAADYRSITVDNIAISAVPEPSTWMLVLAGGAALVRLSSRRRGG